MGAILAHYGVAPYTPRSGWTPIRCPFHEDRNASAGVNGTDGRFHCFVCGIHEDAVGLIMERDRVDFQTAKRAAEEITGQSAEDLRDRADLGGWFPDRPRNPRTMGGQVRSWRGGLAGAFT